MPASSTRVQDVLLADHDIAGKCILEAGCATGEPRLAFAEGETAPFRGRLLRYRCPS